MSECKFCGNTLSWFSKQRDYHDACFEDALQRETAARPEIRQQIDIALREKTPVSAVQQILSQIASRYEMLTERLQGVVLDSADELSKEMPLAPEAGVHLMELCSAVVGVEEYDAITLLKSGAPAYVRLAMVGSNVGVSMDLWNLMHGIPWDPPTPCPFVLQPDEYEITRFGLVTYQKSVMVSSHSGGYRGVE
jgi:hypothetical protein